MNSTETTNTQAAIDELRCSLSTIAGIAASKGVNALQEITCTALAGLARLKAIADEGDA